MESPEELGRRLNNMTDEEFFRSDESAQEKFDPQSNEWQEVEWGRTPIGGDLSIAQYYDKNDRRCKKGDMAYMNILIYTKDGKLVNSVMGHNPFRKR